jgi:hypothetical protein
MKPNSAAGTTSTSGDFSNGAPVEEGATRPFPISNVATWKPSTASGSSKAYTVAPVIAGQVCAASPEFIDVDSMRPMFGVRRTTTFRLLKEGLIKGVLIRREGGKSGRRLISTASVREYFARQMVEEERERGGKGSEIAHEK